MELISWNEFSKVELRVGTIIEVEEFPEARVPAYRLRVDFGPEIGVKKSRSSGWSISRPNRLARSAPNAWSPGCTATMVRWSSPCPTSRWPTAASWAKGAQRSGHGVVLLLIFFLPRRPGSCFAAKALRPSRQAGEAGRQAIPGLSATLRALFSILPGLSRCSCEARP